MGRNQLATELAIRQVGHYPTWAEITKANAAGPPSAADSGVALNGATRTQVLIRPREDPSRRTVRLSITYDAASTYTVSVASNAVATAANTDAATTLRDMRDDINADANASKYVVATCEDSSGNTVDDGTATQLVLRGKADATVPRDTWTDYSVDTLSVSGGAGTLTGTADAKTVTAYVYTSPGGEPATNPAGWDMVDGTTFASVTFRGLGDRFDTAGCDRLHVEASGAHAGDDTTDLTPTFRIWVGPGALP